MFEVNLGKSWGGEPKVVGSQAVMIVDSHQGIVAASIVNPSEVACYRWGAVAIHLFTVGYRDKRVRAGSRAQTKP